MNSRTSAARQRWGWTLALVLGAILALALAVSGLAQPSVSEAATSPEPTTQKVSKSKKQTKARSRGLTGKVTICHRTNTVSNPYSQLVVNASAVDGVGNGDHYKKHKGPVWNPTMQQGDEWGDIIPPVPGYHDGLNWGAYGKLLWKYGCELPTPTPSPSPSTSTPTPTNSGQTESPTPTPSPTTEPPEPPVVPCVGLARQDRKLTPADLVTLIKRVRCAGDITVQADCKIKSQNAETDCRTVVRKYRVKGEIKCSTTPVKIRVRIAATREGFTTQTYKRTWRVDPSKTVICQADGNG